MTDTIDQPEPLVIVELQASNVMRLRAVRIAPDPDDNVVVIGGRNAQGKTSVLNAIAAALGGRNAMRDIPLPIREGEDHAEVRIDLGRFIVTRTWDLSRRSSSLTVTTPDGAKYPSAQKFLDDFLGELTFDPLAFMHQAPKDQVATLLPLVDLPFDLDELEAEQAANFEKRTAVNREWERLKALVASLDEPAEGTPDEEVSTYALLAEHREATTIAETARVALHRSEQAQRDADRHQQRLDEIDAELERLRVARAATEAALNQAVTEQAEHLAAFQAVEVPDLDGIEARIAEADTLNAAVRAAQAWRTARADAGRAEADSQDLTFLIEEARGKKRQAIAEADMPIHGLGFDLDETTVTFNGMPLSQASAAEQLRVSVAVGMALNPVIRIMLIRDGSLLDDDSMAALRDMASAHEYQVWLERVGDRDDGAIIIEDGETQDPEEP